MTDAKIPPVERSVSVAWDQETAFRRFTADFATWWPWRSHSIGGKRVRRIVFEQQVGGRIFEEHLDGRRFQWGKVKEWSPPSHVRFSFHPSRDESTAQDVLVRFVPEGSGTRLELVATGWENWGHGAARARKGYNLGWTYVLNVWAELRTGRMIIAETLINVVGAVNWFRGGQAGIIARSQGEIPRA